MEQEVKVCPVCNKAFHRPPKYHDGHWGRRIYCSLYCQQKEHRLKYKERHGFWPCEKSWREAGTDKKKEASGDGGK